MNGRRKVLLPREFRTIDRIDEIINGQLKIGSYKINAAVVFLDMEGYTQIVYQCANNNTKGLPKYNPSK